MATEAPTMNKTIEGVPFVISAPYAEGHSINAVEAKVLNQTRSENIGNNIRKKLKEALEGGQSPEQLAALVAELDRDYVFTERTAAEGRRLDPYEREARTIAKGLLQNYLNQTGRKITVTPPGKTDDEWKATTEGELDRIATLDEVVKAAKKNVDAKKKTADQLASLLGDAGV